MDLALLVYFISLLDSVGKLLIFVVVACIVLLIFLGLFILIECKQESWNGDRENAKREALGKKAMVWTKCTFVVFCLALFFGTVLPDQRTAYMMVAAWSAQKVAENPKTQEVGQKIMKIVDTKLDQYVEEALQNAEKKAGKK